MTKNKRLTLDDLSRHGSKSFQRLNAGTGRKVSGPNHGQAPAPGAVAAAASDPIAQHLNANESLAKARAGSRSTAGGPECPRVHFTLFRLQALDVEAKYASVKFLLDALRYSGLIADDQDQSLRLEVSQHRVDSYRKEATAITIDYP